MMTLAARGLCVSARLAGHAVAVLRDLDFAIEPGKILGLVGESGAGKSMIGRVLARSLPSGFAVSGGSLDFHGADGKVSDLVAMDGAELAHLLGDRIAFIPQEPLTALNPLLTLRTQFGEHLARLGVPAGDRNARIIDALKQVRLSAPQSLLERYPFQLSGGMCQRVLIAMAFASNPALVIADEPTTALDVSTQATIVQIMRGLQRDHATAMLFITHDLRLAARVCDEIAVLYAGEVVERGPARIISQDPQHPYTRALQAANPPLRGPLTRLVTLPDQMPGLSALAGLTGCRFAPRCPTRDPSCAVASPELRLMAQGHWVRCAPACAGFRPAAPSIMRMSAEASASEPVLVVDTVAKHYPGKRDWMGRRGQGVDAVRTASLSVRPGEFVGVVGESGSGKSTLAKLIMGLEAPTAGRILIDGHDVTAASTATRSIRLGALQMVFQDPQSALNPRRPVVRLVTQTMEAARSCASDTERLARATALLAETGLPPELINRYPAQLSGGQKQRVNIARALCVTPRLLVADEIVSGLDVSVQAQILNLLLDLRTERGIGLVFISHDLAVVRYLCTRMLVMHQGLVVEEGETDAIFARPQHPYTRALLAAAPPDDLDSPWPPSGPAQETLDAMA
ncbi:MAG: ABC transporter ATP-binding protein [Hyphomicrobiales bacterium]|nr:ABC transporter ATP-binding protein [Hyphomicrobiales bacterium]